eukprot:scaffold43838_cov68-Attheya_sp.AAC.1
MMLAALLTAVARPSSFGNLLSDIFITEEVLKDRCTGISCSNLTVDVIGINNNSTIADDIINMTHMQSESKIIVRFKKSRYCQQPHLIGRLPGPALSRLEWDTELREEDDEAFLVGHYNVPLSGRYFIEIIVTMCAHIGYDTDARPICLEDSTRHRLTERHAFIDAKQLNLSSIEQNKHGFSVGHWYNKNEKYEPLYTRHQPQGCRNEKSPRCTEATNLSRFEPYEFKFAASDDFSLKQRLQGKKGKVCFEGASHSRILCNKALHLLSEIENVELLPTYYAQYTQFAHQLSREKIQSIIDKNCTKVIVGTGQWDAGYPGGRPTLFPTYENSLKNAMPMMVEMFRDANVDLYFRTTHYNPITESTGACPPSDWRSPPVIDIYNQITKRLCKEFKIPLIDTNDITGVTWDRAADWCHYKDISGEMEAIHILDRIFA